MMTTYTVREAGREDCKEVLRLISELAVFEKTGEPKINAEDLERDLFDLHPRYYFCLVIDDPVDSSKLAAYAFYYYHFGTWTGRKMYLRDIYVTEAHKKKGMGDLLFRSLVKKGVSMNCFDMDFTVANWNEAAQKFYKARKAVDITQKEAWHIFRINSDSMKTFAASASKTTFIAREAKREDFKEVRRLIQELADFEKMPEGPQINEKDLERDAFDVSPPLFSCYVVDDPNDSSKLIGYAIYYYGYGTLVGQRMYLEDICVTEAHRGKGIGNILFKKVIQKAVKMNFADMDFVVLDWNPAQEFYRAKGAVDITEKEGWLLFRLHAEDMLSVAELK